MLAGVSLAGWQKVHRWLGRLFAVAWVALGVQWVRHGWPSDGWYLVYLLIHGAYLVAGGLKAAEQRRVVDERLARIWEPVQVDQREAEGSA